LIDVDFRGDVACRALQIVGDRPMIFIAVRFADHVGDHRSDTTQLRMAEGIFGAGVGQKVPSG
jgi:hypothetical protein